MLLYDIVGASGLHRPQWAILLLTSATPSAAIPLQNTVAPQSRVLSSDELVVPASGRVTGWITEPNVRGTWTIVWTSLATIFVCTHTVLCLNIPSPGDTSACIIKRRLIWMLLAIFAPEIVLNYAAGQWSRARHSVEDFRSLGYHGWTMRHAFLADMGGFKLRTRDGIAFPLNAKQLHWLVLKEFIPCPSISTEEIWDRSKQDRFFRVVTCFQIGYMILQCIGRTAQRLSITILELNTVGIVVCSLMTSFTWLHKPADIRTPIEIECQYDIDTITEDQTHDWKLTQLDFVDENGPGFAVNIPPFLGIHVIPPERPIQRIPDDRFPMNPYGNQEYLLCAATLIFAAVHLAGWNLSFPSQVEKILWRISSTALFAVTALFWMLETAASWWRLGRWKRLYVAVTNRPRLQQYDQEVKLRLEKENAVCQRKQLPLPWEFWSIMPIAVLYTLARLFLLVESFLELRSVEGTAYVNVQWTNFLPHI